MPRLSINMASIGIAIALLAFCGGGLAQARDVIAPKASVSPAATVKVAPQVLPANARTPKGDAESRAYSNLVDHVAKTMDDFADDNTSENQGRDHLGDVAPDPSTDDADGKAAPVATKKGKRP